MNKPKIPKPAAVNVDAGMRKVRRLKSLADGALATAECYASDGALASAANSADEAARIYRQAAILKNTLMNEASKVKPKTDSNS